MPKIPQRTEITTVIRPNEKQKTDPGNLFVKVTLGDHSARAYCNTKTQALALSAQMANYLIETMAEENNKETITAKFVENEDVVTDVEEEIQTHTMDDILNDCLDADVDNDNDNQ